MSKKTDKICEKSEDNSWEIMSQLRILITAEWDSDSLKKKLEKLSKIDSKLDDELDKEIEKESSDE